MRRIPIDNQLMECVKEIWADIENGTVACSSDIYQNANYCGGFEGELNDIGGGEFTFSKYENRVEVCWISIPGDEIRKIIEGQILTIKAYDPE